MDVYSAGMIAFANLQGVRHGLANRKPVMATAGGNSAPLKLHVRFSMV